MRRNVEWFKQARWGVFVHFLASHPDSMPEIGVSPDEWNRRVDAFDVNGIAKQVKKMGAGYMFISLGQNTGHFCSPNAVYDELVGIYPSKCSKRDLVADLAQALDPVPLLVYCPAHAPGADLTAVQRLHCTPRWEASSLRWVKGKYKIDDEIDERLSRFQRNWEAIIREWSVRWGLSVKGWWFDGCYYADKMYRHPDEPNFRSFAAAVKAGNQDSMPAFNPGGGIPVYQMSEYEDFTAGELNLIFPVCPPDLIADKNYRKRFPEVKLPDKPDLLVNAQYHVLTYMGEGWGRGPPRFSKEMIVGYTKFINSLGGVISWDVPIDKHDGHLLQPFEDQLAAITSAV